MKSDGQARRLRRAGWVPIESRRFSKASGSCVLARENLAMMAAANFICLSSLFLSAPDNYS